MTRTAMISLALLLSAPALAQDKAQDAQAASEAPTPKMEKLLQNCDAHKFETTVESTVDGKPHRSKVKMCGNEGQSDAAWIDTLKDAVAKVETNSEMAESTRDQIVTAVRAEIARLEGQGSSTPSSVSTLPAGRPAASDSLADDYSILPPLKSSTPPPPHVLTPAPQSTVASEDSPAASAPTASAPVAVKTLPPAATPFAPIPAKPRLAFSCISPEFPGGGPCVTLTRDTTLTVKAGEALPSGLSLRFLRQGETKAELALGAMRKGQALRFAMPRPVCSGVVSGEVTIDVVRDGRVVDRQGPSLLHC